MKHFILILVLLISSATFSAYAYITDSKTVNNIYQTADLQNYCAKTCNGSLYHSFQIRGSSYLVQCECPNQ